MLSLKWRPKTFAEVVGQDHVMHTLKNAFKSNLIAQAYMFTGPRGVGKTTTARIISKALNCKQKPAIGCAKCISCNEISEARNLDVIEIDGASNRGIDEIRNIRELIKFPPMNSKYKVIIIDEVHMLTGPAFNALLRTLEEPPPHGKFVMATTDIQKVPMTIISRCQRFDFHRLSTQAIVDQLAKILEMELIEADDESLIAIALKATGSLRDALSTLEQVIAFSDKKITFQLTEKVLGLIPSETFFNVMNYFKEKDSYLMFKELKSIQKSGFPPTDFINGLNEHIRNMIISSNKNGTKLLEVNEELKTKYESSSNLWDVRDLIRISDILDKLILQIKRTPHPDIIIEMALFKILEMDSSIRLDDLIHRIKKTDFSEVSKKEQTTEGNSTKHNLNTLKENVKTNVYKESKVNRGITELGSKSTTPEKQKIEVQDDDKKDIKNISDSNTKDLKELSFDLIQSKWSDFIDYVSIHKPSVGTILDSCTLQDIVKNTLHVLIFDQPRFNYDLLERNKPWISLSLEKIISEPVKIKILYQEKSEKNGTTVNVKSKNKSISKNDKKIVSQIINQFDGELIN
ncbi:MAG: DNA polymerase III subunit gamma/tau [Candidatus Marinimicrobia bacterium]|nr:DNA polymerase III subunit gamma/tau [Candidatus Neomarinimicrobiota bacterium]